MISHLLCQCSYINFLASSRTHLRVIITCCDKKHTPFEYLQTSGAVKSRTAFGGDLIYLRHFLWHEVIFTYVDSTAWICLPIERRKPAYKRLRREDISNASAVRTQDRGLMTFVNSDHVLQHRSVLIETSITSMEKSEFHTVPYVVILFWDHAC